MQQRVDGLASTGDERVASSAASDEVVDVLIDQLIAAKRVGDVGTMARITDRLLRSAGSDVAPHDRRTCDLPAQVGVGATRASAGTSSSPLAQHDRLARAAYDKAVVECREALAKSFSNPTAAEGVLIDLVARELPISFSIVTAQQKLAGRLTADPILANAAWVRTLAQALRDVSSVNHAITRRVEGLLGAASNLRAQRRLLDGPNDK